MKLLSLKNKKRKEGWWSEKYEENEIIKENGNKVTQKGWKMDCGSFLSLVIVSLKNLGPTSFPFFSFMDIFNVHCYCSFIDVLSKQDRIERINIKPIGVRGL